jgi:single-strand DNA-binding protein
MASLNRVELLGKLTNDPEMRYTPSGKGILSFILKVDDDSTSIFPILAQGRLAELCNQHLKKGDRVYLEGKLIIDNRTVVKTTSDFDDEEFEELEKYSVQILAKKI